MLELRPAKLQHYMKEQRTHETKIRMHRCIGAAASGMEDAERVVSVAALSEASLDLNSNF